MRTTDTTLQHSYQILSTVYELCVPSGPSFLAVLPGIGVMTRVFLNQIFLNWITMKVKTKASRFQPRYS